MLHFRMAISYLQALTCKTACLICVCCSMLDVTEAAGEHGELVRKMWKDTQEKTTCQKFGASLRKMLLSGTEWVQGLSQTKGTPFKKIENTRDDISVSSASKVCVCLDW